MALDTVQKLTEAAIAYVIILLVGYLAYLAVTGPDTDLELGLAIALLGISYVLLHGKEGFTTAIVAWRGRKQWDSGSDSERGDDHE